MEADSRALHEETRRHLDVVAEQMRRHLDTVAEQLRQHVDAMEERTRRRMRRTRRHFDVVAEHLVGEIRLVAEGVVGLGERLDRTEHALRRDIVRSHEDRSALLRVQP
jgi:hypothetical protein